MELSLDKRNQITIEIINLRIRIFNFVRIKVNRKRSKRILIVKCRMTRNK